MKIRFYISVSEPEKPKVFSTRSGKGITVANVRTVIMADNVAVGEVKSGVFLNRSAEGQFSQPTLGKPNGRVFTFPEGSPLSLEWASAVDAALAKWERLPQVTRQAAHEMLRQISDEGKGLKGKQTSSIPQIDLSDVKIDTPNIPIEPLDTQEA